jgi:hypothetical protein
MFNNNNNNNNNTAHILKCRGYQFTPVIMRSKFNIPFGSGYEKEAI